jgi:TP901 family phage tail tape measure protein
MASTAAILNILVTANTTQANAALAKTQAQLKATQASAVKSSAGAGAAIAKGMKVGGLAVAAVGAMSIKAAADWEDAFAGVRKTVNATEGEFKRMEKGLRGLAKTMPITATEVADLAAEAGALGIKSKDIVKFTKVAAMLGEATDMSANDAANGLARLSNVMGTSSKDFERLGSTLVALGNKGASTEAEILSMSQRMAGAAKIIGLTESEVLAMGSALASVGIRAEMGGSAISRVWLQIDDAIAKGSGQLKAFADIAGMSEQKFTKLFDENANAAVIKYATGLKQAHDQGQSVSQMLKEVDLNEIRVRETLLKASAAHTILTKAQEQGNRAWEKNNALNQEAQTRFKTVASQASILKNRITDLFISLGQKLEPATRAVLKVFNDLAVGKMPGFVKAIVDVVNKSVVLRGAFEAVANVARKVFGGVIDIAKGMAQVVKGAVDIVAGVLTGDWARAWDGVKSVVRGAIQGAIGIIKTLTAPVRAAAELIGRVFKAGWEIVKTVFSKGADFILGVVTTIIRGWEKMADVGSKLPGPLGDAFDDIQTTFKNTADSIDRTRERIRGSFNDVSKAAKGTGQTVSSVMGGISRDVGKHTQDAAAKGTKNAGDLRKGVVGNVRNLSDGVGKGMNTVVGNVNKALKGFGVKKQQYVAFEAERADLPQGNQRGGIIHALRGTLVPGRGNGDKVPAMLEPGEVVINKRAVAAAGGAKRVNKINRMIPRFATGGAVPGDTAGLNSGILGLVGDLVSRFGGSVSSGLRSTDTGSLHSTGNAADYTPSDWRGASKAVNTVGSQLLEGIYNPGMFGGSPVSWDSGAQVSPSFWGSEWANHLDHIHLATTGAGGLGASFKKLKNMVLKGPAGPLKEMGQAALDKTVAGGNEMLRRLMPSPTHGNMNISAGGTWDKNELMKLWSGVNGGLGDANIAAAVALAESSGNPNAFGPPDGRGLWQIEWNLHPEVHKYGSPYNPTANARMAGDIYRAAGGWSPWVAYTNGNYAQFLQGGGVVQKLAGGGEAGNGNGGGGNNGTSSNWSAHFGNVDSLAPGAGSVHGGGGGPESPSIDLQEWFPSMTAAAPVAKMHEVIGGIGLDPSRMSTWASGYTSALDYDEFATNAMTLDRDDADGKTVYGLFGGLPAISGLGGETGWLNMELAELFSTREQMVAALPVVDSMVAYVKDKIEQLGHWRKIAHNILDSARRAENELKRKITNLEGHLSDLERQLKDAHGPAADNLRERIAGLKDRIGELKANLPLAANAVAQAEFRAGAVDDIRGAFAGKSDELGGVISTLKYDGAEDGSWPSLETLQGRVRNYQVLGVLPELGTLGGDIFRVHAEIESAWETARENAAIGTETADVDATADTTAGTGTDTAALQQQIAANQTAIQAMLTQQAPVFAGFFNQLQNTPQFHTGGISPGGLVNTLPREGIFTEEQMAALGGRGNVEVNVSLEGMDVVVETLIDGKLAQETRKALTRGPTVGRKAV